MKAIKKNAARFKILNNNTIYWREEYYQARMEERLSRKILRQKKRQTRLVAIIFAISPFVSGNGAIDPSTTGGGSGGGEGGGMLHGGEMGLGGVGSGVGGGGGRS